MKRLTSLIALVWALSGGMMSGLVFANPEGLIQSQGLSPVAPLVADGNALTINQMDTRAILHWQQFNIAPNEVTRFIQPSAQSIALNRIFDANPSQILGSLQANGSVILLNPNGVLFGLGAQVNVNGLIASSLHLSDEHFLNGRTLFEGSALGGAVKNAGTIETALGGFVYLLAPNVENSGVIRSPEGHIVLAAGTKAYLSNRPDGRGFLVEVSAPAGEALNLNAMIADGGRVNLFGRVVNQSGLIQANSIQEKAGRIELVATEQVLIKSGSRTLATGGSEGLSAGGTVIALADKKTGVTHFEAGAEIAVSGGLSGGAGGFAELSASDVRLGGHVWGAAQPGFQGGTLLIDPHDYVIDQTVFDSLIQNQSGLANIFFEAEHTLRVAGLTSDPASYAPPEGLTLRFTAGGDLVFSETRIGWDLSDPPSHLFDPSSPVWNLAGTAGNRIILEGSSLVGNGGRFDLRAGGNIEIRQLGSEHSYLWAALGGEILLKTGGDLIAPSALDRVFGWYSGIRLGPISGSGIEQRTASRLMIDVAGNFLGGRVDGVQAAPGFVLTGGTADVSVGGHIGAPTDYVNLTLGKGEIHMSAGKNIYLGLVQDLGLVEGVGLRIDPGNRVDLIAGGDIHLDPWLPQGSNSLDEFRLYYPASFLAQAGGSIFIEANLSFWPSLAGRIHFTATDTLEGKPDERNRPFIRLFPADPSHFAGLQDPSGIQRELKLAANSQEIEAHEAQPVRFVTQRGDIRNLVFDLNSPVVRKGFEIASGKDLSRVFVINMSVPEGTEGVVRAEGDIFLARSIESPGGGIVFSGEGHGVVRAGGDLNLGDSNGIRRYLGAGLIDLSVGGNLEMAESSIVSYDGASIRIHGLSGPESAVGGRVNVGTNAGVKIFDEYLGIITLRDGDIDIKATGDVDVNSSQVSAFGGNIRIESLEGNINAGFGSIDELTRFGIREVLVDKNGQPVLDQSGQLQFRVVREALVPGSGIFTYHADDPVPFPAYPPPPEPVLPPLIRTAEMERLEQEMIKRSVLGQDISLLEAAFKTEADLLSKAYQLEVDKAVAAAALRYEAVKAEHRKDWKLGDIHLKAGNGSVVVPPAGIRGRKLTIEAKNLDLQGGQISGDVQINVGSLTGGGSGLTGPVAGNIGSNVVTSISLPSIPSGGAAGGVSLGGLSGSTGSLSSASSGSVSTASSAVTAVQEKVVEQTRAEEPSVVATAGSAASRPEGGEGRTDGEEQLAKKKGSGRFRSLEIRRGVVIQVEVNEK